MDCAALLCSLAQYHANRPCAWAESWNDKFQSVFDLAGTPRLRPLLAALLSDFAEEAQVSWTSFVVWVQVHAQ